MSELFGGFVNPDHTSTRRHNNETNDRHARIAQLLGADGLSKALQGHPSIAKLLSGCHEARYPHSFDEIEACANELHQDITLRSGRI